MLALDLHCFSGVICIPHQLLSLSSHCHLFVVLAKYENQINVFSDYLEELPDSDEPVWILGEYYNIKTGRLI